MKKKITITLDWNTYDEHDVERIGWLFDKGEEVEVIMVENEIEGLKEIDWA